MKFSAAVLAIVGSYPTLSSAFVPQGFAPNTFQTVPSTSSSKIGMVLEMPKKEISKLETLKVNSDHLIHPLLEVRHVCLDVRHQ